MKAELIQSSGYPVEKHTIVTDDGYILTMHRIPKQEKQPNSTDHYKPVLLVHALFSSGGQFVVNGNKSLAFMLSDLGFDVWILHVRGTSYSLSHTSLSSSHPKFWDFSWHEIGLYDLSCAIDNVLNKTNETKLYFIGHSQGPTVFFVLMSVFPKYNEKVAAAYLLQPAALIHSTYPIFKHLIQSLLQIAKEKRFYKIKLQNSFTTYLSRRLCGKHPFSVLCTDLGLIFLGGDTGQVINKHEAIQLLLKYVYDNVSVKQLIHYGQIHGSKMFQMYDYGPLINRNMYHGNSTPSEYDLSQVTVPIVVMFGTKDALTTEAVSLSAHF